MNECKSSSGDKDVTVLVVSCDRYKDIWHPFFHCFFKYWPDCPFPICLASNFEKYPDERVRAIQFGPDSDYSSNLIKILESIHTKWVMLWFEDALIASRINNERILQLIALAQDKKAGYLKFTVDLPIVYTENGDEIGEIPKGVKYRSGIGLALYQKQTLLNLLTPGLSAWELDKSTKSHTFSEPFMALSQQSIWNPPIKVLNGVIKGKWTYGIPDFLRKEGLGYYISNRAVQTFWQTIYTRLYLTRSKIYMVFKWYWRE